MRKLITVIAAALVIGLAGCNAAFQLTDHCKVDAQFVGDSVKLCGVCDTTFGKKIFSLINQ